MKTAHQFARELLAGPDLPISHFDPSLAGMDDEVDESLTEPKAEINAPDSDCVRDGLEQAFPPFITIVGTQADPDQERKDLDELRRRARLSCSDQILDTVLAILNQAVTADRAAIEALLIDTRIDCNRALALHPTIQVAPNIKGLKLQEHTVSTLGLLNGVVEALTGERIAAVVDCPEEGVRGTLFSFVVYHPTAAPLCQ